MRGPPSSFAACLQLCKESSEDVEVQCNGVGREREERPKNGELGAPPLLLVSSLPDLKEQKEKN